MLSNNEVLVYFAGDLFVAKERGYGKRIDFVWSKHTVELSDGDGTVVYTQFLDRHGTIEDYNKTNAHAIQTWNTLCADQMKGYSDPETVGQNQKGNFSNANEGRYEEDFIRDGE